MRCDARAIRQRALPRTLASPKDLCFITLAKNRPQQKLRLHRDAALKTTDKKQNMKAFSGLCSKNEASADLVVAAAQRHHHHRCRRLHQRCQTGRLSKAAQITYWYLHLMRTLVLVYTAARNTFTRAKAAVDLSESSGCKHLAIC